MKQTVDYIPAGHPLIAIREILNQALREMDILFASIYEERGRYSVPPECFQSAHAVCYNLTCLERSLTLLEDTIHLACSQFEWIQLRFLG